MKMIRTFLFTAFALLPLFGSAQNCAASFTYTTNGLTITFDGTINPQGSPNTMYYWWFSDNSNSSSLEDPTYTFSGAGTYSVCFSFYDQATQCQDSVCQTITVGSSGCSADFTWIDTAGYVYFQGTSTLGNGGSYVWDFGDGNFGSGQYPWHQYANAGIYQVCLTVYDSLQNFCDSTCHTVVIQGSGGCSVDFTWVDSVGYAFFISSSTLGNGGYYYWDFGDGNYSSAMNPSHVYSSPGVYMVCVTVYDSMQVFCDSTCHQVLVQSQSAIAENSLLQNSLLVSPNPADDVVNLSFIAEQSGSASIIFYDAAGRIATTHSIILPGKGQINETVNTTSLAQGIYLVKLEVNGSVAWTRIALTHQ